MCHTREILRQKWLLLHSHRLFVGALGVSHGTITKTTQRATHAAHN
jgi:hypothetical protein